MQYYSDFRTSVSYVCVHQVSCKLLEASSVAYKVTRPLASLNSCMDPILYFLAGQDVCSNLKKKSKSSASTPKETQTQSVSQHLTTQI